MRKGLIAIVAFLIAASEVKGEQFIRYQEPEFMTFEELVKLVDDPSPGGPLEDKLKRFWETPEINNEAHHRGVRPRKLTDPKLGSKLVLATWNIEKSFHIPEVVRYLTSEKDFQLALDPEADPDRLRDATRQRKRFLDADILMLQEMDIGVKRSDYVHAARELAKALDMNYTYAAEQLEIDPVMLGLEKIYYEDGAEDTEAEEYYRVDPAKYKGAFGVALLSRYPIKHAEVFQLKTQAYNWYWGEKPKPTFLENSRRFGTQILFQNEITREMKVGGRIYFRVDLHVPELPDKTLTLINIHLEIKCQPQGRELQMAEILSTIRDIPNTVIVAGDFNSAPQDLSPTSIGRTVKRAAKDPTNWFSAAVSYLSPHALVINTTRGVSNVTKNFQDPTARHVSVVAPNPVKGLFKMIEEHRFSDGAAFDFRGEEDRSMNGKDGTLSNSNQRDRKGFKTTFQVKRPLGPIIGKYRLDWIFVKSGRLFDPKEDAASYRFAPHFGETLEEMNTSLLEPVSDHHPNVVDLPFEEPKIR